MAVASRPILRQACGAVAVALLCALALSAGRVAWASAAAELWLPLADRSLIAANAGNALDFSHLSAAGPAGQFGWARRGADGEIAFERQPARQRFLVAPMIFSNPIGKIPDKAGIDRLVQELRRTGYNAVRLHFIDALLMDDRDSDFDFDPEQFDRLHYLMARLKSAGIYWIADGMSSNNGGYGNVRPHRFIEKYSAKFDVAISEAGFEHWARLVDRIWGTRNPYTGVAPMRDPAMLGMILVNEGALTQMATVRGGHYPSSLEPMFRNWLSARYSDEEALRAAWGHELRPGESLSARISLPSAVRGNSARSKDFARFISEIERAAFGRMDRHVRDLGFGGLTTAFDSWGTLGADVTRSALGWIDMHGYHDVPTNRGQVGSTNLQTSLLDSQARAVRALSNVRQWGKPFTVTEYGQPFWNRYRHEIAALVPTMAAHQGWSAISLFGAGAIQTDYGPSDALWRQAIYPFGTGADPITRAGERLAALLFLRGDVSPSPHRIRLHLDSEALFSGSAGWEWVPEEISRLAFIAPIGLDFGPMPERATSGDLSLDLLARPPAWGARPEGVPSRSGVDFRSDPIAPLRAARIVSERNRSKPEVSLFESDTGEMVLDARERRIQISTARSSVIVLKGGDADNPGFAVKGASGPALFAVASLDGLTLPKSRHLLVWVLTDAVNSGMKFDDERRTRLVGIGTFPPLVRAIQATLRLEIAQSNDLKAWPLSLAGERRRAVPLKSDDKGVELLIDTAGLPDGPAVFFEIAAE